VSAVRSEAARIIEILHSNLGDDWVERVVLPELHKLVADGSSYTTRVRTLQFFSISCIPNSPVDQVSALYTASKLLQSRNESIRGALLPFTVRLLSTDKVPNVRMAAVQALISAKSHMSSGICFRPFHVNFFVKLVQAVFLLTLCKRSVSG
jgi:hypothetical protein